jgi:hypothetical protein
VSKDKIEETTSFIPSLNSLGYDGDHHQYENLFHLTESDSVRHILYRGTNRT